MIKGMINTIVCGDCLIEMPKIPDKSIDMILCDLPMELQRVSGILLFLLNHCGKNTKE